MGDNLNGSLFLTDLFDLEPEILAKPVLPVNPIPITPSPVTPSPVTPSSVTPSPVTTSPVTPSPVTPSPLIIITPKKTKTPGAKRTAEEIADFFAKAEITYLPLTGDMIIERESEGNRQNNTDAHLIEAVVNRILSYTCIEPYAFVNTPAMKLCNHKISIKFTLKNPTFFTDYLQYIQPMLISADWLKKHPKIKRSRTNETSSTLSTPVVRKRPHADAFFKQSELNNHERITHPLSPTPRKK
jgi:hypothetical protein